MAKKSLYFADAERMYVIEQMTFAEITNALDVADKTLRLWAQEGEWQKKRKDYLASRQSFHEELYDFTRLLMRSIKEDFENGNKPDAGRLYTFARLLPQIIKVKDYEDVVSQSEGQNDKSGLSEDSLKLIQEHILGL